MWGLWYSLSARNAIKIGQTPQSKTSIKRYYKSQKCDIFNSFFQRYQVCIRPEAGMCCVQYQVCADQSNAFTLSSGAIATGIANIAILDSMCTNDYTEIIGEKFDFKIRFY